MPTQTKRGKEPRTTTKLILCNWTQLLMSRWKYQFSYDHWSQASWAQPVFRWVKLSGEWWVLLLSNLGVKLTWLLRETGNSALEADPRFPPTKKLLDLAGVFLLLIPYIYPLISYSDPFRIWHLLTHFQILTLSNSDTFQLWHFPILTLSDSDTFLLWPFPILTLSNSDTFLFWHFPTLTLSNSDTFQFCHFPILTLSYSDPFQFWHFPILSLSNSDTFQFWHFPILTLSNSDTFQLWHFQILRLPKLPWFWV